MSGLQKQIRTRMKAKDLSIAALEREAGLKINAVRNILSGQSKKPSAETLQAIANVLDCSVKDLLEKEISNISDLPYSIRHLEVATHEWDAELFNQTIETIQEIFEKKSYIPSVEEALFFIKEIYIYALEKNSKTLDPKFAEWFIERNIS